MMAKDNIGGARFKSRFIRIGCVFIILVLMFASKNYPGFIEKYYSRGVYPTIRRSAQYLLNYIPFSVGDVLYVMIIIFLLVGFYQFIRLIFLKKFRNAGFLFLGFILKVEIAIAAFYILWALNYFRQPAVERLKLDNYGYNANELVTITSMLIDSANTNRSSLLQSDLTISNGEITLEAVLAIHGLASFDPPLVAVQPRAKTSLLSTALSYIGTAGYYNPFTGEAQFNSLMPVFVRPFVACHEMAHQMGIGAEDEANFVGFIAGVSSTNKLLKYSAYYLASQEFMSEIWRTDSTAFKKMKERISPAVLHDLKTEREYWMKFQGQAARLSSIFYDSYLKINKQPGGLKTYNKMIILTMAYYRKKGIVGRSLYY